MLRWASLAWNRTSPPSLPPSHIPRTLGAKAAPQTPKAPRWTLGREAGSPGGGGEREGAMTKDFGSDPDISWLSICKNAYLWVKSLHVSFSRKDCGRLISLLFFSLKTLSSMHVSAWTAFMYLFRKDSEDGYGNVLINTIIQLWKILNCKNSTSWMMLPSLIHEGILKLERATCIYILKRIS